VEIHAHVVACRSHSSTVGGRIMEAYVCPTLEVMLTESPAISSAKLTRTSAWH
jgi:predicted DNA-binding protein with PD1-like motif